MIKTLCALALAGAVSGHAIAAGTLATGPVPAWVKPVSPPAVTAAADQAPVRLLLQDQQVDLQPGKVTRYSESLLKIQSPQGLSAGNVTLTWNPDTDTATVHKLLIRRGDKVIDVLASQSFTVVRRESNLENAMLDGVLTGTIQPEGLQVGDIVDFAASITQSDPALKGHVEEMGGGWNALPVDRAHLRFSWPSSTRVRLRGTTGLPPLKTETKGGVSAVELSLDSLPPLQDPKGAPSRYGIMRIAEMSDFASWADLAQLMMPLYEKAATLGASDSPLHKEMDAIAARSADPKARAEAALALVQDRVRYVFLGMNDGGLVPADAETTWQRRFGDCKGKTALLLALLKGLGIQADPVLVSVGGGDGLDQRLPMIALFNHVLVRATIAGRTYWLDGTRTGDDALDQIRTPDFRWGLPLLPGATLVRMDAPAPERPLTETAIRIDASKGIAIPAPIHVETILRDDDAIAMNQQLLALSPDVLDRGLREYWRNQYDFVTVKATSSSFDAARREEKLVMDGDAQMDWSTGWYEMDGTGVGYKADLTRDPGPNQDAPFAVAYPYSNRTTETILLPSPSFKVNHGDPIDVTIGGIAYHRTASFAGNRFTVEEDEHAVQREFPASDARVVQEKLRALANKAVFLGKQDYGSTDAELDAALKQTPTTADDFTRRGNMLLDRFRSAEARADFDHAIALDPKSDWALAGRGLAHVWSQQFAEAQADFDAAEKLDPRNASVYRGRGLIADFRDQPQDAIAAYSRALDLDPASTFALSRRAADYRKMGDEERALADVDAVLKQTPDWPGLHLLRANILIALGRRDEALHQAALMIAASPNNAFAHSAAGRIYARFGKGDEAVKELDTALRISPGADGYINRAEIRPASDIAGRQADLDAAARLEPRSIALYAAQAGLQEDRQAYAAAIAAWTASLAINGADPYALVRRGIDEQRFGQSVPANKDFADAHGLAKDPDTLAGLCREKAAAGVGLDLALAECRAAAGTAPQRPDIQDDLGFAEWRAGHLDEAAAAFAKAQIPSQRATALYGLALIEAKRGAAAKEQADRAAALKLDPDAPHIFDRGAAGPPTAEVK